MAPRFEVDACSVLSEYSRFMGDELSQCQRRTMSILVEVVLVESSAESIGEGYALSTFTR